MEKSFTSGSFGEMSDCFSKFHDYQRVPFQGAGYSVLYTVISGERKLFLKALNQKQGKSAENLAHLQREYKLLERLYGNEHIVRCIDWREDTEVGPCIVMEYVDGETLTEYLKTSLSNREKKRILKELLDALAFIHNRQVVHNDLKPENILITRNGHNIKLIDFGYADSDSNLNKATGGTKAFASPELVRQETTDVTSDIYSLGFIVKALFPHRYVLVVRKCLHKEVSRRYQRVSDVNKAILRSERIKWLVLAALTIAVVILARPKKKVEEVLHSGQNEPVPQVVAVPNTNQSNALNFDSIHLAYQTLYDRYKESVKEGIADGSLEYIELAAYKGYYFGCEMLELKLKMMPDDEDLQLVFEEDYQNEYIKLYSSLFNLYSYLPSYHQTVEDDSIKQELRKKQDEEYDKLGEMQKQLNEMERQKACKN